LSLDTENNYSEIEGWPYSIDCALKVLEDAFVFKIPCSLTVAMIDNVNLPFEEYQQIVSNENNEKKQ
jgi:hypothetical protein